jgi:hypothetical protein
MCLAYLVNVLSRHCQFLGAVDTIYEYTYQLDGVRGHPHNKHNGQPQNGTLNPENMHTPRLPHTETRDKI